MAIFLKHTDPHYKHESKKINTGEVSPVNKVTVYIFHQLKRIIYIINSE